MAFARLHANWEEVASLLAMTHNVHCTRQSQIKRADDFHPYKKQRRRLNRKESVNALISAFVKKRT